MTHLMRVNAPKSWPIERKTKKFVAKPAPGPHRLKECMPLGVILRELLKISSKKRDIKIILNNKNVLVNNKVRKEVRFPVGILDTLSLPDLNKFYRIVYNKKGKLNLIEVPKEETLQKTLKITNKTMLTKGKLQLNLYDGENLIIDKNNCKVGDSVVIKDNKILKYLKFEKDAIVYLTGGKHIGTKGIVLEIKKTQGRGKNILVYKIDNDVHETLADYAYVIEK